MADQLRPYIFGEKGAFGEGNTYDSDDHSDGSDGSVHGEDTPLLTVSDINPDMLEVTSVRLSISKACL